MSNKNWDQVSEDSGVRSHTFLSVLSAFVLLWSHALSVQDAAEQAAPARVQIFLDQALALAASLPDGDDKASAYVGIAEVEWKAGAHSEARKHFDLADGVRARMPQDDLTRALRAHLSETRAGVGDIEGALEQLRRFPGDHPGDQEELVGRRWRGLRRARENMQAPQPKFQRSRMTQRMTLRWATFLGSLSSPGHLKKRLR